MRTLYALIAGLLMGFSAPRLGAWLMLRLLPPAAPQSLLEKAEAYEQEAAKLVQLAIILRKLAEGRDPDDILAEMPPELAEEYKAWEDENG